MTSVCACFPGSHCRKGGSASIGRAISSVKQQQATCCSSPTPTPGTARTPSRSGVAALQAEMADLITAIPREEAVTWAEKLAVPLIMQFGTFAFLPLALAYRLESPILSTAIGQFMLFRKEAYAAIGGYAAIRQAAVDDLALGRLTVACHRRWRMADATRRCELSNVSESSSGVRGIRQEPVCWIRLSFAALRGFLAVAVTRFCPAVVHIAVGRWQASRSRRCC